MRGGVARLRLRIHIRSRGNMQIPYRAHTVEPVLERGKGRRLGKQHQQPIEALVEVWEFVGLEQLQPEVCALSVYRAPDRSAGHIQVNTGDSSNCTSLSIWIRMLTVISSSALDWS